MANSLTALNKEYWAKEMQREFFKSNIAIDIAETKYEATLRDGDTLNIPYFGYPKVQTYSRSTDLTIDSNFATNEQLSVDTFKAVAGTIDRIDSVQNSYDAQSRMATNAMKVLNNYIDQAVFSEYSNASSAVYAADARRQICRNRP
jgi:hypothetical protein